jgi:hypothetical protein
MSGNPARANVGLAPETGGYPTLDDGGRSAPLRDNRKALHFGSDAITRDTCPQVADQHLEIARILFPGDMDLAVALADPEGFEAAFGPLLHSDFATVIAPSALPPVGIAAGDAAQQVYYGMDGFLNVFREVLSAWESWVINPTEFIVVDESRVLVITDIKARSRTHHVEIPVPGANLLTFREAKIARLENYLDRRPAFEAAGLRK